MSSNGMLPGMASGLPNLQAPTTAVAMHYGRAGIEALIPHRGEILFLQEMKTWGSKHFTGVAYWDVAAMGLHGHFPQRAVVPAVFLVEAVAQLAGAGVLATRKAREVGVPHLGVLMGIRRCSFRQMLHVNQSVDLEVRTRQMGEQVVNCEATVSRSGVPIASIEVLIGEVPLDVIASDREV